jgi:hypothetical protein
MRRALPLFAATLLLTGCGLRTPEAGPGPPPPSADDFIRDGLLLPGETRAELEEALGEPTERQVVPMENRHDPAITDTIVAWTYPGVVFHLHRVGSGGPEFLTDVEVMDNRYLRFPGVGIGVAREEVRAAMGPPQEEANPSEDIYLCRNCEGPDEPVTFRYGPDGRVRSILFSFYLD